MLTGVGVSCRISYSVGSYISISGLITLVGEERAIFLISFSCNDVVSVQTSSCLG